MNTKLGICKAEERLLLKRARQQKYAHVENGIFDGRFLITEQKLENNPGWRDDYIRMSHQERQNVLKAIRKERKLRDCI